MNISRRTVMVAAGLALTSRWAGAQEAARIEIPFRLVDNQPITQVTLNGRGPYGFLIDTGAASFCLDQSLCEEIRLEYTGAGSAQGAVGAVPIGVYRAREMILGGRVRNRNVEVIGIPGLAQPLVKGLFPMVRRIAETGFDFDRRVFIIDTRPAPSHEGFDRVEARASTSRDATRPSPRVRVDIDGRPATLILDTGANGGLFLKPDFVRRHGLWEANPHYRDSVSVGVAGPFRTRSTTARELRLGRYRFRDLPVRMGHPDDTGRDGYGGDDGLLGMEVLRRLNFFLRPRQDELWLRANTHIQDIYRYNRSGLELEWRDERVRVVSVSPDSPAARAGLQDGDTIVSASAGDGSYDGLAWALTDAPGTTIAMSVAREGEPPRQVELTLEEPYAEAASRRVAPDAPAD